MEASQGYVELRQQMCGRRVISKRLFLRTLQIYLAPDSPAQRGLEIWCEPNWRIRGPSGVLTESASIEAPASFGDDAAMTAADATIERASKVAERLLGSTLDGVEVDTATHAITLRFSGDLVVETSRLDPRDSVYWVMRDADTDLAVRATPSGLRLGTRAALP